MSSITVGDFQVTLVRAGSYWWDGGAMFGVVPKTLWSKQNPADELNRIEAGFNCFVIENGETRILVETGGGVRHDAKALERMRVTQPPVLGELLASRGFEPESFDLVINTHLHWDHVGGNTVGDSIETAAPAFANATYIAQEGELHHARKRMARDAVSYRPVNYETLVEGGRMRLLDGDAAVVPGVRVQVAPGHNRDMMVVIVESGGETWCHLADLVQYTAQLTPTWVSAFDLYPLETIENKMHLVGRAAAGDWWCSFGHDPKTAFAKVQFQEGKWEVRHSRP